MDQKYKQILAQMTNLRTYLEPEKLASMVNRFGKLEERHKRDVLRVCGNLQENIVHRRPDAER